MRADGLAFPNDIQFSPDGSKVYVANLGGGGVALQRRWKQRGCDCSRCQSGTGCCKRRRWLLRPRRTSLLVGAFAEGGIAISNSAVSAFPGYLVQPTPAITGATGLMIHDGYLYVSGLFTTNIRQVRVIKRTDRSFVGNHRRRIFPKTWWRHPMETGFWLASWDLPPAGEISPAIRSTGRFVNMFASPSQNGFTEATAFVVVPTQSHRRFQ